MTDDFIAISDPEAERAVLGAILTDPALLDPAQVHLQARHFASARHRAIYAAMQTLGERGTEADLVTVRAELAGAHQLDAAGGVPYLAGLVDGLPRVTALETWARAVREKARRRAALDLAQRLAQQLEADDEETDALLEGMRTSLERLVDAGDRGIRSIADVMPEAVRQLEAFVATPRGLTGVTTGLPDLDRLTSGMKPGQLWVVAAFTSRGKSSLCTQIAQAGAGDGARTLLFSMEMPPPDVAERMLLGKAGIDRWSLRTNESGWSRLAQAMEPLCRLPLWFDPRESPTVSELRTAATRHRAQHGLDLVVVDHLQRLSRDRKAIGGDDPDWLAVGENVKSLKSIAMRLKVPVLVACQLNAGAEDKRPSITNLARAGTIIGQEADVIAFLHPKDMAEWRDGSVPRPTVDLIVEKHRGGALSTLSLIFDRAVTRFYGIADEAEITEVRSR